ncbi:MAG: gcvT, partial [Glaciihabitans sp.]|nr:gcvT [Glaciihabitans sp.]
MTDSPDPAAPTGAPAGVPVDAAPTNAAPADAVPEYVYAGERLSPLHNIHVAAGASFTDFAGWQMPVSYGS